MQSESSDQFAEAYPWISISFFERILRREHKDESIVVKDYTLKAALGKGENYMSQMLRVRVNYSSKNDPFNDHISLIIKAVITDNVELSAVATEMGLFRKEIITFQTILPEVEKLLRSIGDNSQLSAKCYDANDELSYLVFEDLSVSGYANVNRRSGLDVEHFKHVLTKVAKWHAATAILVNENPSIAQEFQKTAMVNDMIRALVENTSFTLSQVVTHLPVFAHLAPKLSELSGRIFDKMSATYDRKDNEFNTLTHGDMWSNNIMFRHAETGGAVEDAILVDFQMIYWGPAALDVVNALFTSSAEALRAHDWNECVVHYHDELVRTLTALKYPKRVPSLEELQTQRKRCGDGAIFSAIVGLILRNVEDTDGNIIELFKKRSKEDDQKRLELYLKPKIRSNLEFLIQYLNENGHFD